MFFGVICAFRMQSSRADADEVGVSLEKVFRFDLIVGRKRPALGTFGTFRRRYFMWRVVPQPEKRAWVRPWRDARGGNTEGRIRFRRARIEIRTLRTFSDWLSWGGDRRLRSWSAEATLDDFMTQLQGE